MLQYINKLIPKLKQYSKSLDQKSIFIDQPWVFIDENGDYHNYTFHGDGRLLMSLNGTAKYGSWEYISSSGNLVITRAPDDIILLNQVFINTGLMFLKKDGLSSDPFILINKNIVPDLNVDAYLRKCFIDEKKLSVVNTNDSTKYYVTKDQFGLFTSPGNEVYDENLEPIKEQRKLTLANTTLSIANGQIKETYYEKRYSSREGLILIIQQKSSERPVLNEPVFDESGEPLVDGTYQFKPVIDGHIKSINVEHGMIVGFKSNSSLMLVCLGCLLVLLIAIGGSIHKHDEAYQSSMADTTQKIDTTRAADTAKTEQAYYNNNTGTIESAEKKSPSASDDYTVLPNSKYARSTVYSALPVESHSFTVKLNVLQAKLDTGYYTNSNNTDSSYYALFSFGNNRFEYKIYNRYSSMLEITEYQVGYKNFKLISRTGESYVYQYLDGTNEDEYRIAHLGKYSDGWEELSVTFFEQDLRQNRVLIMAEGTMLYNPVNKQYRIRN